MRALTILALPLALSACWAGKPFYTAADARPALPAGKYSFTAPGDVTPRRGTVAVTVLPSGMTRVTRRKEAEEYGFAPLPGSSERFVGWQEDSDDDGKADEDMPYWLLVRRGSEFLLTIPQCEKTKEIALAAGATMPEDVKIATCIFPSRSALEGALLKVDVEAAESLVLRPK